MTTQENALMEVYNRLAERNFIKFPMHNQEYCSLFSKDIIEALKSLPYNQDKIGEYNYSVRKVDQLHNIEIWK